MQKFFTSDMIIIRKKESVIRLHPARRNYCRSVPLSMADRALLQMDQAASPDKSVLRHFGKRGEDPVIAISVYALVAIVKKLLKLDRGLYTILQILSVTLFEKTPILQVLSHAEYGKSEGCIYKQPNLFD